MRAGAPAEGAATVGALLRSARARLRSSATPALDARVLAKAAFGLDDAGLALGEHTNAADDARAAFEAMLARAEAREPVAYIVGEKEFWSLTFALEPGVLVPRPDSETLVAAAIDAFAGRKPPATILDLGVGSGCLLAALLTEFPNAHGLGVDKKPRAVALAARNLDAMGLGPRARIARADWRDDAFLQGAQVAAFDLVVANPPYIPLSERSALAPEVRDHEDPDALFSGEDGLDDVRAIMARSPQILNESGVLILEIGAGQACAAESAARAVQPDATVRIRPDLSGAPRALVVDAAKKKSCKGN
ncbi:MAG: peptide chain release factor N(5)-glutamine methyltransferase [Parvularculaceae bacterium]